MWGMFTGMVSDEQGVNYTANDDNSFCRIVSNSDLLTTDIVVPETYQGSLANSTEKSDDNEEWITRLEEIKGEALSQVEYIDSLLRLDSWVNTHYKELDNLRCDINDFLTSLESELERVHSGEATSESVNAVSDEWNQLSRYFDYISPRELTITSNGGGNVYVDGDRVRNATRLFRYLYPKPYSNVDIKVEPDDYYEVDSIVFNGQRTEQTSFESYDSPETLVVAFRFSQMDRLLSLQREVEEREEMIWELMYRLEHLPLSISEQYQDKSEIRHLIDISTALLAITADRLDMLIGKAKEGGFTEEDIQAIQDIEDELEYILYYISFDVENILEEIEDSIIEHTFECNAGGAIWLGSKRIRNGAETIRWTNHETMHTFTIEVIPDEDYSVESVTINGLSTDKRSFVSTEVDGDFVVVFKPNVVERTIHVATAGTLPDLIAESERYTLKRLTLTGYLNGTDFRLLRDMAGCNYLGQGTGGKLKKLDFSAARIVKGGEMYVDTDSLPGLKGSFHYTVEYDDQVPEHVSQGCKLEEVIISDNATAINSDAFRSCNKLTSVNVPASVTSIGGSAFQDCYGLKSFTIPNSVTSIGIYAFSGCSGLTSVTIPESVTSIGGGAFSGCSGLTSVTVPASVTSIGLGAFENCYRLKSFTIPGSVTCIESCTFFNCKSLTSVIIPNSVTSIGQLAFGNCI